MIEWLRNIGEHELFRKVMLIGLIGGTASFVIGGYFNWGSVGFILQVIGVVVVFTLITLLFAFESDDKSSNGGK